MFQKLIRKEAISSGTFIGFPSCSQRSAKPGWNPHIHFLVGNDSVAYDNPWEILKDMSLTCNYIEEVITNISHGIFFKPYANNGSNYYDADLHAEILEGSIKVISFAGFESHHGYGTPITPYKISWGIDGNTLGSFSFSGQLPRYNPEGLGGNATRTSEVMYMDTPYIIDYSGISGSLGNGEENDFSSISQGHWNTLQSTDSSSSWFIPIYPCSTDFRKFKDGKHKLFVSFISYCDSVQADTVDIIIDNNPPQTEVEKVGDYAIKVTFSEPMDTTSFDDNIDIKVLCHNMAEANIDSMRFSEDLTELTMFLPDTFYYDEAYHVELSDAITDIAGTPLDGNANCTIDDEDNYETIVGGGNCNHTFIVQTGATVESWESENYYQDCIDDNSYRPYWQCGNFGWFPFEEDAPRTARRATEYTEITVSGKGAVFPYYNNYDVELKQPPGAPDVKMLKGKWKGYYRIRLSDIRILFDLDKDNKLVFVESIDWRDRAYR